MINCSIIQKSHLEGAMRLDAEYYCSDSLIGSNFHLGKDVVSFVQYGTSKELNEENRGYPVLRLNEFEDWFAGQPTKYCNKISEQTFNGLKLKKGDVLICRTNGNPKLVGKAALVAENTNIAFASYLFRVQADSLKINSATLTAFLNSKIGRAEIEKFIMPSIQSNFSPAQFRQIKIPIFPPALQKEIETRLFDSYELLADSKSSYQQAEDLLLEELGLKNFDFEKILSSVVNYSDVLEAERIDAEYFQPKYEKLISKIKERNYKTLPEIIENVPAVFNAASKPSENFKYVELSNINPSVGIIDGFSEVSGREAPGRAKRILKSGDVIVSSVEGSLEKVALVDKEQDGHLASTGFFQLRSDKILPEVLLVIARSLVFQMQLEKQCAGTILTAVPKEAIKNIVVPILPKETQQKIADLVRQSHKARKKAKELLEEAKRKVEGMIENK
jgi:restriction endonuclease S subunit